MILDYLKKNTASIHLQVEKANLAKDIVDHTISINNYVKLLAQNFEFYHTIEQALLDNASLMNVAIQPFLTDQRSQSLKKDLLSLDPDIKLDEVLKYPYQIDSENAAIGALYVSEGSALGGLVIGKHLSHCPELITIKKHHFFGNEVSTILAQWKKFQQIVNEHFNSNAHKEEILESAIKTFQLFEQIIQE